MRDWRWGFDNPVHGASFFGVPSWAKKMGGDRRSHLLSPSVPALCTFCENHFRDCNCVGQCGDSPYTQEAPFKSTSAGGLMGNLSHLAGIFIAFVVSFNGQ